MIEQGRTFEQGKQVAIHEIAKEMRGKLQRVPPGEFRLYGFEGLDIPDGAARVYQVRYKAQAIPFGGSKPLYIDWAIIRPDNQSQVEILSKQGQPDLYHEFLVRTGVVRDGKAVLGVINPPQNRNKSIYFEGDDGLEILYKVGSFEMNFVKRLLLIVFRLAFLSAIGLLFGTFVSFPVACFCVLAIFAFCFAMPWWLESIGADVANPDPRVDPYGRLGPAVRIVLVPLLKTTLPNFATYDGVEKLIDGYAIPTRLILRGAAHTLVYGVVLLALPGWLIFRSREIAETIV